MDGYCTSACRPLRNDPQSGLNPDCPSDNATCEGAGATGVCVSICHKSSECRTDYACFRASLESLGCLPRAISECDPTRAGSCPRRCMGMPGCYEDTCADAGDGTVGECAPGCDIFGNAGCPGGRDTDCHASDATGEGFCTFGCTTTDCRAGTFDGACGNFFEECAGGHGCLDGRCRRYCNDATAATQCAPGAVCMKLSPNTKVPTAIAGLCSK